MAITIAASAHDRKVLRQVRVTLSLTGTYETGGFSLPAAAAGLVSVENVVVLTPNAGGYSVGWDRVNKKLMLFTPSAAHTHTGPSHSHNVPITKITDATGKAAVYWNDTTHGFEALNNADDDNAASSNAGTGNTGQAAASAGAEVANGADIGTVVVAVIAEGFGS